jgi:adenylate kinase
MNMPEHDAIFIIGPQGSGKGTQGRMLARDAGYFYWEMGAILREEAKKDTPFGIKVKSLIDEGHLLEDDELFQILSTELPEIMKHKRIVFDGIPRTLGQGRHLVHYLQQNGYTKFATILIDVPREESIKRLLERAHHEFRADDTEEKINYRLEIYETETVPVVEFLSGVSDLYKIDGVGTIDEIQNRINTELKL